MSFSVKARILDESGAFNKKRLPEIDGEHTQKERLIVQKYDLSTWHDYYKTYKNLDPFITRDNPKGVVLIASHNEGCIDYGVFSDFSVERDEHGKLALYAVCTIYESNEHGRRIKGELDEGKTVNLSPTIIPKEYKIEENKEGYTDYHGDKVYDLHIQKIHFCEISEVSAPNFVHSGFDKDDILKNGIKRINEKDLIFNKSFTINNTNIIMSQQDEGVAKLELTPEQLQNMLKAATSAAIEEFQKKTEILKNNTSVEDDPKEKKEDDLKNSDDKDEDDDIKNKCSNSDEEPASMKNTDIDLKEKHKEYDKELKNKLKKAEDLLKNAAQLEEYIDGMVQQKIKNQMTKHEEVAPKMIIPAQSVNMSEFNHKEVLKNSITTNGIDLKKAESVGVSNEKLQNSFLKIAEEKGVGAAGIAQLKRLHEMTRNEGYQNTPEFREALRNSISTGALPAVVAGITDNADFVNPQFPDLFKVFNASAPREKGTVYYSQPSPWFEERGLTTATGKQIKTGDKILTFGFAEVIKSQRIKAQFMGASPEVPKSDVISSMMHSFCPVYKVGASISFTNETKALDYYGFIDNAIKLVPGAIQEAKNKALLLSLNQNNYDLEDNYTDAELSSYGIDLGRTMSHIYYKNVLKNQLGTDGFYQRPLFLTAAQTAPGAAFAGKHTNFYKQDPDLSFMLQFVHNVKKSRPFEFMQNGINFINPFGSAKVKFVLPSTQIHKFSDFVTSTNHAAYLNFTAADIERIARTGLFGNQLRDPQELRTIFAFGDSIEIHFFDYDQLAQEDAYKLKKTWFAHIEHQQFPHLYYGDAPEMSVYGERNTYNIEHSHLWLDYFTFGFRNPYGFYKFESNTDLASITPISPMQKQ